MIFYIKIANNRFLIKIKIATMLFTLIGKINKKNKKFFVKMLILELVLFR